MTHPPGPANSGYTPMPSDPQFRLADMAGPPRRKRWPWIAGAIGALALVAIGAAVGANLAGDDETAPAAVVATSTQASPTPSLARWDLEATCVLAVPAMTTAADLITEWANTPDAKVRDLDEAKYAKNVDDLRAVALVAHPQILPHVELVAGVVQRLKSQIIGAGSYTLRSSEVGKAGMAVAELCAPYAR